MDRHCSETIWGKLDKGFVDYNSSRSFWHLLRSMSLAASWLTKPVAMYFE